MTYLPVVDERLPTGRFTATVSEWRTMASVGALVVLLVSGGSTWIGGLPFPVTLSLVAGGLVLAGALEPDRAGSAAAGTLACALLGAFILSAALGLSIAIGVFTLGLVYPVLALPAIACGELGAASRRYF